jgi:hypothetical protein
MTVWFSASVIASLAVTSAEAAKPKAGAAKKSPEARFAKLDGNKDEKLSLEEFVGKKTDEKKDKAHKQFRKRDKDGDASLSLEEFKTRLKKKKPSE